MILDRGRLRFGHLATVEGLELLESGMHADCEKADFTRCHEDISVAELTWPAVNHSAGHAGSVPLMPADSLPGDYLVRRRTWR